MKDLPTYWLLYAIYDNLEWKRQEINSNGSYLPILLFSLHKVCKFVICLVNFLPPIKIFEVVTAITMALFFLQKKLENYPLICISKFVIIIRKCYFVAICHNFIELLISVDFCRFLLITLLAILWEYKTINYRNKHTQLYFLCCNKNRKI